MNAILQAFGLDPAGYSRDRIGTGHIHETYKLIGDPDYILQRVNKNVFKQPEVIAANLRLASDFLEQNYPGYPFLRTIQSLDHKEMVYDEEGFAWRLFLYQKNAVTMDKVSSPKEAFLAAAEFARLSYNLEGIDVSEFRETIPRFHDLALRYEQFEIAREKAENGRRVSAHDAIHEAMGFYYLVEKYNRLIESGSLKRRITHNDTKINNILFDSVNHIPICVIDLDTLMPGYFIYDLGDMVRTFVSPVSEEENDFSKIIFRKEMYDSLLDGYLSSMDSVMSEDEKRAVPFAGKMMTYIMALRFLADYLNGDIYYHTIYPGQNLMRAKNQLRLLQILSEVIPD